MAINCNIPFNSNLIKIYNNQFTNKFRIRYDNNPIYIILPKLPCDNQIKQSNNNYYCYLVFSDQDIDYNIHNSLIWLNNLENYVSILLKELRYKYKISQNLKMCVNWNQNIDCFDQFNVKINNFNDRINSITHLMALIEIPYVWKNHEQFGIYVKVRQLKCYSDNVMRGVSLLNEDDDDYLEIGDLKIDLQLPNKVIKNIITNYLLNHKNNQSHRPNQTIPPLPSNLPLPPPPPPPPVSTIPPPPFNLPPPPPLPMAKTTTLKSSNKQKSNCNQKYTDVDKSKIFKIQLDDILVAKQNLKKLDNAILIK